MTKKIHRFIGNYQLGVGTMRIDDAALSHQMRSVLKLQAGELVVIGDGTGLEACCTIAGYDQDAILLDCISLERSTVESGARTTLYCAILKSDYFEIVAQKATEVGIAEIVPIITARTIKLNLRAERVSAIIREAAEQSGRGMVPTVREPIDFDEALTLASHHDKVYFFDVSGGHISTPKKVVHSVGLFVGPEGGWSDEELESARSAGLEVMSLGSTILRAETAATVASYLVVNLSKK